MFHNIVPYLVVMIFRSSKVVENAPKIPVIITEGRSLLGLLNYYYIGQCYNNSLNDN